MLNITFPLPIPRMSWLYHDAIDEFEDFADDTEIMHLDFADGVARRMESMLGETIDFFA